LRIEQFVRPENVLNVIGGGGGGGGVVLGKAVEGGIHPFFPKHPVLSRGLIQSHPSITEN
jgi:hypothetical protein